MDSIIILPRLPDSITLSTPLTPRPLLPSLILILKPRDIPHSDPRIGRSKVHNIPRSNLSRRQSDRSALHASSPTTYNPPTRPRRD